MQSRISTWLRRTWIPSSSRSLDDDVLELDAVGVLHIDPVLAAADGHVADGDVVGRDHDPAADDRPGLARHRLRVVEDERPLVDPGREVDGRRLDGPRRPDDREQRDRRGGRERRAGAAELAAVLGPGESQQRQAGVRQHLEHEPRAGEEAERGVERRVHLQQPRRGHRQAQLEQAERERRPAGLVGQQAVVDRHVEREPDPEHQPGELERPPLVQDRREHRGDEERQHRRGEPRLDPASQRVGHRSILCRKPRAAIFIPTSVSAAGNAHWPGTPASESVRVESVSAGHGRVVGEHDPALLGLEAVLGDEPGEERVVLEPAPEARRADHLLGAVQLGLDAEAALARGLLERLVPAAAGRIGRLGEAAQQLGPLCSRRGAEAGQAALREQRAGRR